MNPYRAIVMALTRISPRNMLLFIFGLSALLTWCIMSQIDASKKVATTTVPPAPQPKMRILTCSRNIPEGSIVQSEDISFTEVEATRVPVDALTDVAGAIGHPSKFVLLQGSLLCAHDLAPITEVGFSSKLHAGERAVTLPVDSTTGVAGFISPDSHVDIMVQVGSGADAKARAILSDIRVVATGTTYQKQRGESTAQPVSTVTVAVQPADAGRLINAMSAGKIYLTLRSTSDHAPVAVSDVNSLFAKQLSLPLAPPTVANLDLPKPVPLPELAPPPAAPSAHEVEEWQGPKRDVATVLPQ